jgi:hypothetical protein
LLNSDIIECDFKKDVGGLQYESPSTYKGG